MTPIPRRIAAAFALPLAVVLIAGCGGGEAEPTPSLPASAMASPTAPMPGSDPATWSPVIVKPRTARVELLIGQVAIAPRLEYADRPYLIESSDESVVQALEGGQVVGFRATGEGAATVTIYRGKGKANDGKGKIVQEVEVLVGP